MHQVASTSAHRLLPCTAPQASDHDHDHNIRSNTSKRTDCAHCRHVTPQIPSNLDAASERFAQPRKKATQPRSPCCLSRILLHQTEIRPSTPSSSQESTPQPSARHYQASPSSPLSSWPLDHTLISLSHDRRTPTPAQPYRARKRST